MSLLETLTQQISGSALQGLSRQLGADENSVNSAVSAALPMIIGAMAKNASTDQGAQSLNSALEKDHDGSILDNLSGFLSQSDNGPGAGILKHVFGGNRNVAEQGISQMSGLNPSQAGGLLENLAPLVMGYLGRSRQQGGMNAGSIASMLLGEREVAKKQSSGAMDLLSSFLDRDGDGSMLDDIGGMLGGFLKK